MNERGEVRYGNTTIPYTVVRSARRKKTVEITLDPAEGVLIAAPVEAEAERIRRIVAKRAPWIIRTLASPVAAPARKEFVSGESLSYLGRQVRLFVTAETVRRIAVKFENWSFQITIPVDLAGETRRAAVQAALVRWYRARAEERLPERVAKWALAAGYAPSRVLIRDQRQRWGSCGADGAVRFNWRIIMAPLALIDYVVIHELAHLKVRRHTTAFWDEVARLAPDYAVRRLRLKELGPTLTF